MSAAPFIIFLAALLIANVLQVVKHRRTVGEMRVRHIMSLHRIDMYQRALTTEPVTASLTKFVNEEVKKV